MDYRNFADVGNSSAYLSGRACVEPACAEPAGTAWSPYWCFAHNVERLDGISATLKALDSCYVVSYGGRSASAGKYIQLDTEADNANG